jgi:hypothetical protein
MQSTIQELKEIIVICFVTELTISEVVTHFEDKIWVPDINEENGGSHQTIKKRYAKPRIQISFQAQINATEKLNAGTFYTDGINMFRAISDNIIVNVDRCVESFSIPKKIVAIQNNALTA